MTPVEEFLNDYRHPGWEGTPMADKLFQQREEIVKLQLDLRDHLRREKKLRDQLSVIRALLYASAALNLFAVLGLTGALP